jgi:hypothetical protein
MVLVDGKTVSVGEAAFSNFTRGRRIPTESTKFSNNFSNAYTKRGDLKPLINSSSTLKDRIFPITRAISSYRTMSHNSSDFYERECFGYVCHYLEILWREKSDELKYIIEENILIEKTFLNTITHTTLTLDDLKLLNEMPDCINIIVEVLVYRLNLGNIITANALTFNILNTLLNGVNDSILDDYYIESLIDMLLKTGYTKAKIQQSYGIRPEERTNKDFLIDLLESKMVNKQQLKKKLIMTLELTF